MQSLTYLILNCSQYYMFLPRLSLYDYIVWCICNYLHYNVNFHLAFKNLTYQTFFNNKLYVEWSLLLFSRLAARQPASIGISADLV